MRGYTRWNAAGADSDTRDRLVELARRAAGGDAFGARGGGDPRRQRPGCARGRVSGGGERGARGLRRGDVRHQGTRAQLPEELPRQARRAHRHRRSCDVGQAVAGDGASARSRAPSSARRARRFHRRSRLGGDGDGDRVRELRRPSARSRRIDLRGGLRRDRSRDRGDAPPAGGRAESDGVDRRVGRREALRRTVRHLHDVFGDRHRRHQPDLRKGAFQCGACARRNDRLCAHERIGARDASGDRPHDVRADDALRAGGHARSSRTTGIASSSMPPEPAASRWKSWSTRACWPP